MWADALKLATSRFHIPPEAFWRLSLKEWRMLTQDAGFAPLPRVGLDRLMQRFPDLMPKEPHD